MTIITQEKPFCSTYKIIVPPMLWHSSQGTQDKNIQHVYAVICNILANLLMAQFSRLSMTLCYLCYLTFPFTFLLLWHAFCHVTNKRILWWWWYVCMYKSIYNAPLLQPKQSRVRARRPYQKDVFLACYRIVSVSVLDHEVTTAESSTVVEHNHYKQQSCVVQNWKCDRLALADRHVRQSVGGDDLH